MFGGAEGGAVQRVVAGHAVKDTFQLLCFSMLFAFFVRDALAVVHHMARRALRACFVVAALALCMMQLPAFQAAFLLHSVRHNVALVVSLVDEGEAIGALYTRSLVLVRVIRAPVFSALPVLIAKVATCLLWLFLFFGTLAGGGFRIIALAKGLLGAVLALCSIFGVFSCRARFAL